MNIISWNVNGIRAMVKNDFFKSVAKMNPTILCLQETKAQNPEVQNALLPLTNYHIYHNPAKKKGYSGTAILSKNKPIKITKGIAIDKQDTEGRIQCAEYLTFYLVNVYVPNSGQQLARLVYRKKWDANFLRYLKILEKTKPVIVCGDFNVAHQPMDLKNNKANYHKTAGYMQIEIDGMQNLLNAGFIDSFRYLHPTKVTYTFWSYRLNARVRNIGWRIDYIIVSKSLVDNLKESKILSGFYGSDHCPISLEIDL